MFKKLSVFILVICLVLSQSISVFATTGQTEGDNIIIENTYIRTTVNKDSGRFSIRTVDGSPLRDKDQHKKLLFMEITPETSFTTFRIDGSDFIYGNKYDFNGYTSEFIEAPKYYGNTNYSKWRIGDVYISQYLIVENEGKNAGDVRVKYEVENRGERKNIGGRILLDTMIGENDGSSIMIPNSSTPITNEREFIEADVPSFWYSAENTSTFNVVGKGSLETGRYERVDKFVVGHWEGLSRTKWDYKVDNSLDFSSKTNKYESADSAVALYFNEKEVANNSTVVFQTTYGIGDITSKKEDVDKNPLTYSIGASASVEDLDVLEVDGKLTYSPNPVDFIVYIDNSYEDSSIIKNITFDMSTSLERYSNIFTLCEGETKKKSIDTIQRGEIAQIRYKLNIKEQGEKVDFDPFVDVKVEGQLVARPQIFISIPKLEGMQNTSFLDISPKKIFSGADEKKLFVLGEGFNYINDDDSFDIILRKSDTKKVVNILFSIDSDRDISLSLPEELEEGLYDVEIIKDGEIARTFTKELEITGDEKLAPRIYPEYEVNGHFRIKGNLSEMGGVFQTQKNVTYVINDYIKFEGDMTIDESLGFFDSDYKESDGKTKIEGNGKFYIDLDSSGRVPSMTFYEGDFKLGYFDKKEKINEEEVTLKNKLFGLKSEDDYKAYVFRDVGIGWPVEIENIYFIQEEEEVEEGYTLEERVEIQGALLLDILGVDFAEVTNALEFTKIEDVSLDSKGVYYNGGIGVTNPYAQYGIGPLQTSGLQVGINTREESWEVTAQAPMPTKKSKGSTTGATPNKPQTVGALTLTLGFVNWDDLDKVAISADTYIPLSPIPAKITKVSGSIDHLEDTEEMPTTVWISCNINDTLSPQMGDYSAMFAKDAKFEISDKYMKASGEGYTYVIPTSNQVFTVIWDHEGVKGYTHNGIIVTSKVWSLLPPVPWKTEGKLSVVVEDGITDIDDMELKGSFKGSVGIPDGIPGIPSGEIKIGEAIYEDGSLIADVSVDGIGVEAGLDLKDQRVVITTKPKIIRFIGEGATYLLNPDTGILVALSPQVVVTDAVANQVGKALGIKTPRIGSITDIVKTVDELANAGKKIINTIGGAFGF